jgi:hypothetical protein
MRKTFHGSCHCGAIRFEADLDLSEGIRKCNCTFCVKSGYRKAFTSYEGLRVLQGKEAMRDYQPVPSNWPPGNINHYHCTTCSSHPFSRGYLDQMGGNFWAVNVSCLDDATQEELGAAPIVYEDGLNNRQQEAPAVTSWL